jgi:hypothetical protein
MATKPEAAPIADALVLSTVVNEVRDALDAYQALAKTNGDVLPKLASAEFEFKTVIDTKAGFTFSILIFKFGHTVDKQTTHDVIFTYEPAEKREDLIPLAKTALSPIFRDAKRAKPQPVPLKEELIKLVAAAAQAVKAEGEGNTPSAKDELSFKKLAVTVAFGITRDTTLGGSGQISLVTIAGSIEKSANSVQQVKLTFAPPEDKSKK